MTDAARIVLRQQGDNMFRLFALCASAVLASAHPLSGAIAAPQSRPSASVRLATAPEAAIEAFISAFNALDRSRFDPLFAEDVTLFFPTSPFPLKRVEGKAETLKWFGRFFDAQRTRGAGPNIKPQDLKVQEYGDVAVATFHLGGGENIGRRTVVLRRQRGQWAIAHLHASSETERR